VRFLFIGTEDSAPWEIGIAHWLLHISQPFFRRDLIEGTVTLGLIERLTKNADPVRTREKAKKKKKKKKKDGTVTPRKTLLSHTRRDKKTGQEKASRSENEPCMFRIKFAPGGNPRPGAYNADGLTSKLISGWNEYTLFDL
jgi:hypothetical protein